MARIPPAVRAPTEAEIRETAASFHLRLTDEEVALIGDRIEDLLAGYQRLHDRATTPAETPDRDRTVHGPPPPEADPYNAVVTRCTVAGAETGPLDGYAIGLKDMIAVAGVEMSCGSHLFEGYVPRRDATVVERLLDAGGTITALLNLEDLAYSGSGELSVHGPVLNPRDPDYLAGGSSSGSAAAVLTETVDIALGTDQGGSSRIPASWCGVVGLKPTYGLVPYTGIVSRDPSIDHPGIFTRTVETCAQALEAIAGPDPLDPRGGSAEAGDYTEALETDPAALTVGVVDEGFGREESDDAVDATVRDALDAFAGAGATLESVSIPWHTDGSAVLMAIALEGSAMMVRSDGMGRFARGRYDPRLGAVFGRARRANAADFPPMQKLALVLGEYLSETYQGRYYATAQNLLHDLAAAYDEALAGVDVLALPTTPHLPHAVEPDLSLEAAMDRAFSMNGNTSPFDASGHPAVSVPCGRADGLPVGLMLVGERSADGAVLGAAHAFESTVTDWASV